MADTITKQEPKLSVRKPGHWRNKAWILPDLVEYMKGVGTEFEPCGDGEWLGTRRWISQEMADQAARVIAQRMAEITPDGANWFRCLGPVFFPDGDDA